MNRVRNVSNTLITHNFEKMTLSIIIVNYNVKLLLEQCLRSVQAAIHELKQPAEVIVIDNNSTDDSIDHISTKFPQFKYIINKENRGFAKACNQGIAVSRGKFILFLNPDTMVLEDCFKKCINVFEANERTGALGVRMINGAGKYLPESKRGNPTTAASFYRLFGLAMLFPHSKRFAKYYLGHLDEKKNHPVDILSGAFMMVRKEVLEHTGYFDEDYFMYGEDIDLSYRIKRVGYINFYLGEVTIVHLKGQSTPKKDRQHIRNFYKAMNIFVQKHYTDKSSMNRTIIHTGIWVRKNIALVRHFMMNFFSPN